MRLQGKAQRLTASREAERQKYGELVPAIQAAEAAATSLMNRVGELEALVLEERAKCASVERARDDANTRAADERNEASGALQAAIKRAERAEEQLEALSEQTDEIAVCVCVLFLFDISANIPHTCRCSEKCKRILRNKMAS